MSGDPPIPAELGGGDEERELAEHLRVHRPLPAAGFRGSLARRLTALDPGWGPRPARLKLIVAGWVGAGVLLIGVGALLGVA